MNKIQMQDSLKVAGEKVIKAAEIDANTNWWMWLAFAEFFIISLLVLILIFRKKDDLKQKFKNESLKQDIDFNNIINSSFNSKKLFDELKVKCHPDRFPTDKEKNVIAENIFQNITKNQNNVKRLLELKEEAIQKLNINF